MAITLSRPDITEKEIERVLEVLRSPHLSRGPMLARFEETFARYLEVSHAVGVSSGTSGLHLAVIACGIKEGDEVITSPFSFVASANCLLYERALPVFVDIDPQTWNIDPQKIEEKVSARTKAILPVHVFGLPCAMDQVMAIARRHNLKVIEDACEAVGAEWGGRKVGTFGDLAVFAFYPNKQMTSGEGGMVVTGDRESAALLRSLRDQGRDGEEDWLTHTRLGYNYRLDELSAALGMAQLERIRELLAKRERVAEIYAQRLRDVNGVQVPTAPPRVTRRSWFVYVIQLKSGVDRNKVMEILRAEDIPSRPYFPPIHLQPFYRQRFGHREGALPVTEAVARSTLALPFHGLLTEGEVDRIAVALQRAIAKAKVQTSIAILERAR